MNLSHSLLALGLAALPATTLALDGTDDANALVQKLGDKDYKVRRDAYKKLEKLGPAARAALQEAAKNDDAEVRWNASRLLDRLDDDGDDSPSAKDAKDDDGAGTNGAMPRAPMVRRGVTLRPGRVPDDLQQELRELQRRLDEFQKQFDQDGAGFFRGSPFGVRLFENPLRFGDPGGAGGFELQPGSTFSRSSSADGKSESLTIKVDANGHVTAEQEKDGQKTKVEADSIETFRKEHPEMLPAHPFAIAVDPAGGPRRAFRVQVGGHGDANAPDSGDVGNGLKERTDSAPHAAPGNSRRKIGKTTVERPADGTVVERAPAADKPRLGIELAPVPAEVADYLELDGAALQVMRVLDDMPAARRGLKARDILLEVDGKRVHSYEEIVQALDGKDPTNVPLVVLRRGEIKKL